MGSSARYSRDVRVLAVAGLVRAGDSGTSRHKFVGSIGHTSEDETGMIYMRARWMDPALGRRISLRYSMVQR